MTRFWFTQQHLEDLKTPHSFLMQLSVQTHLINRFHTLRQVKLKKSFKNLNYLLGALPVEFYAVSSKYRISISFEHWYKTLTFKFVAHVADVNARFGIDNFKMIFQKIDLLDGGAFLMQNVAGEVDNLNSDYLKVHFQKI
jgi:hypothetical protein